MSVFDLLHEIATGVKTVIANQLTLNKELKEIKLMASQGFTDLESAVTNLGNAINTEIAAATTTITDILKTSGTSDATLETVVSTLNNMTANVSAATASFVAQDPATATTAAPAAPVASVKTAASPSK